MEAAQSDAAKVEDWEFKPKLSNGSVAMDASGTGLVRLAEPTSTVSGMKKGWSVERRENVRMYQGHNGKAMNRYATDDDVSQELISRFIPPALTDLNDALMDCSSLPNNIDGSPVSVWPMVCGSVHGHKDKGLVLAFDRSDARVTIDRGNVTSHRIEVEGSWSALDTRYFILKHHEVCTQNHESSTKTDEIASTEAVKVQFARFREMKREAASVRVKAPDHISPESSRGSITGDGALGSPPECVCNVVLYCFMLFLHCLVLFLYCFALFSAIFVLFFC